MDGLQAEFLLSFIEKSVVVGTDIYFEIFHGKKITCSCRYRQLQLRHMCRPSSVFKDTRPVCITPMSLARLEDIRTA